MRKALCLTGLLAALAVGGTIGLNTAVNAAADRVTMTETTLQGNAAAAAGLQLHARMEYAEQLFWNIDCDLGGPLAPTTTYEFYISEQYSTGTNTDTGVHLESYLEYGLDYEKDAEEQQGLGKAFKQLADTIGPGEEAETTVYVKDYFDYYPLSMSVDIGGRFFNFTESEYLQYCPDGEAVVELSPEYDVELFAHLRQFFRIPVLPDQTVSISIGKHTNGHIGSMGSGSTDSDCFYMNTHSVVTPGMCYFTFSPLSEQGKLMDLSLIPGGYGLYALPWTAEGGVYGDTVQAHGDQLAMVYPLSTEAEILLLQLSDDGSALLLHTKENDRYILTVIDLATMTTRQKLDVCAWPEEDHGLGVYGSQTDGTRYFAAMPGYENFYLLVEENGQYTVKFSHPWDNELNMHHYFTDLCWNGETLAIGYSSHYRQGFPVQFGVAVYDADALLYTGTYGTSLHTGTAENFYSYYCQPAQAMQLRWK